MLPLDWLCENFIIGMRDLSQSLRYRFSVLCTWHVRPNPLKRRVTRQAPRAVSRRLLRSGPGRRAEDPLRRPPNRPPRKPRAPVLNRRAAAWQIRQVGHARTVAERFTVFRRTDAPPREAGAASQASPSKAEKPPADAAKKKAEKLRFQFRFQPWKDVLDWFAQQADLSLVIPETTPQGTFNYSDTREYTPAEAIDLLNSVLQTKGYHARAPRSDVDARQHRRRNSEQPGVDGAGGFVGQPRRVRTGERASSTSTRSGPKTSRPRSKSCSGRRDRSSRWPSRSSCRSPIRRGGCGPSATI